ncbi:MAG: hypothetical protein R2712_06525 [Vicinamibacterales bacterium]
MTCIVAAVVLVSGGAAGPARRGPGDRDSLGARCRGAGRGDGAAGAAVEDGLIAGAVAGVARHGTIGYLESVGVQDLETRAP